MLISTMPPLVMFLLQVLALGIQALPKGHNYEVVIPQQIHAVYKRDTQDKYPQEVKYQLHIEGKPLVLHLERNEELLTGDYTETSYSEDHLAITRSPEGNKKDHCHYEGYVENDNESKASISTCSGISGIIMTQGRRILIEPWNLAEGAHVVYDEEEEEYKKACAATSESLNDTLSLELLPNLTNNDEVIDQLLNSKKYIEMVIVADNSIFKKYGSAASVKERIFALVNYMNTIFKGVNIMVALKGLEIWDTKNFIEVSSIAGVTLKNFNTWREKTLLPRIDHDNAQLLTNTDFDGPEIGRAALEAMCNEENSAGVIQDHQESAAIVGTTFVHELFHNLGVRHDDENCPCPLKICIMEPLFRFPVPITFSKCSLDQLRNFLMSGRPRCLLNKPKTENIITPPLCGNNFIEKGEDCDCGTVEECTNPCCNAATCKLKPGAKCAEGGCCENCKFKEAGSTCQKSLHDCDLPDTCDGKSSHCLNLFKKDGASCMDGKGYCLHGTCPTMENQCKTIWGPGAVVGSPKCFSINTRGRNVGYCTKVGETYKPCLPQDVQCGVLYCEGGNSIPTFPGPNFRSGDCKGFLHPYGMTETGVKCADEKVCYKGACIGKETAYESITCSSDCNMTCDLKGQCHCDESKLPNSAKCNA